MGTISHIHRDKIFPQLEKPLQIEFLECARTTIKYIGDIREGSILGSSIRISDVQECCEKIVRFLNYYENKPTIDLGHDEELLLGSIKEFFESHRGNELGIKMGIKEDLRDIFRDPEKILIHVDCDTALINFLVFVTARISLITYNETTLV